VTSGQHIGRSPLAASDRERLLAVASRAADAAADVIRKRANDVADITWTVKRPSDFVSEVDTGAEHALSEIVARELPDATIVGEELSPDALDRAMHSGIAIIADPLDGTTNFLHGYPEYSVSIAVLVDGVTEAGVVLNVPHGDRFTATLGGDAFRNAERIHVSRITDPSRALLGTGFPFKTLYQLEDYQRQFAVVLRSTAGIRRAGSAALDLCDVACGRFDAFWELMLAPWDMAAGILIVREAGGVVTDAAGADASPGHGAIIAGNPAMHAWLLEIVRGRDA
jgi:myo-inositol-1(or 4)-monophosphatase